MGGKDKWDRKLDMGVDWNSKSCYPNISKITILLE